MPGVALVNAGDLERDPALYGAERRVLGIQAKLHQWARDDPRRRFDDLFGLVCALFDPGRVRTTRYRYRGTAIPSPWAQQG